MRPWRREIHRRPNFGWTGACSLAGGRRSLSGGRLTHDARWLGPGTGAAALALAHWVAASPLTVRLQGSHPAAPGCPRCPRQLTRMQDAGCRTQDAGCRMPAQAYARQVHTQPRSLSSLAASSRWFTRGREARFPWQSQPGRGPPYPLPPCPPPPGCPQACAPAPAGSHGSQPNHVDPRQVAVSSLFCRGRIHRLTYLRNYSLRTTDSLPICAQTVVAVAPPRLDMFNPGAEPGPSKRRAPKTASGENKVYVCRGPLLARVFPPGHRVCISIYPSTVNTYGRNVC